MSKQKVREWRAISFLVLLGSILLVASTWKLAEDEIEKDSPDRASSA
jgi:hypothetical protein